MDKIICVGKNYLDHAAELGDPVPETPVLFMKPPSVFAQLKAGENPAQHLDLRHGPVNYELELVFRVSGPLNPNAHNLDDLFDGFTLGLDLTKRELQSNLKKAGHPWEIAKVFPSSAIVGPWLKMEEGLLSKPFSLEVNGQQVQAAKGVEMRSSPLKCLFAAGAHFPLVTGDLLFTGTPAGVGALHLGDHAELFWNGKSLYSLSW